MQVECIRNISVSQMHMNKTNIEGTKEAAERQNGLWTSSGDEEKREAERTGDEEPATRRLRRSNAVES